MNALVLAEYLGADIRLPPSVRRCVNACACSRRASDTATKAARWHPVRNKNVSPRAPLHRESFAKYFTMEDAKRNEVTWQTASAGALLDVDAIARHYATKGAGPAGRTRPDVRQLSSASVYMHVPRSLGIWHLKGRPLQSSYPNAGVKVLPTLPADTFPDCMHPNSASLRYRQPEVKPEQVRDHIMMLQLASAPVYIVHAPFSP